MLWLLFTVFTSITLDLHAKPIRIDSSTMNEISYDYYSDPCAHLLQTSLEHELHLHRANTTSLGGTIVREQVARAGGDSADDA